MILRPLKFLARMLGRSVVPRGKGLLTWTMAGITPLAFLGGAFPVHNRAEEGVKPDAAVEERIVSAMVELGGLAASEVEGEFCPPDKLRVSWQEPAAGYTQGSYITPLGPRPTGETESVNGILLCDGSTFAYMGFEAFLEDGEWVVLPVPEVGGEDDDNPDLNDPDLPPPPGTGNGGKPAPKPAPSVLPSPNLPVEVDSYARYEPQDSCDPKVKPGVGALRTILLDRFPSTRSGGITRGCGVGGRSEHKEGRAFDWMVSVNKAGDKAAAKEVIDWLLATDDAGNAHAMLRRMGVMYVIWNKQILSAYRINQGWRGYNGASSHTDHIHFSFSWDGALGKTSFWSGTPVITGFDPFSERGGSGGSGNREWRKRDRSSGSDRDYGDHSKRRWSREEWQKRAEEYRARRDRDRARARDRDHGDYGEWNGRDERRERRRRRWSPPAEQPEAPAEEPPAEEPPAEEPPAEEPSPGPSAQPTPPPEEGIEV